MGKWEVGCVKKEDGKGSFKESFQAQTSCVFRSGALAALAVGLFAESFRGVGDLLESGSSWKEKSFSSYQKLKPTLFKGVFSYRRFERKRSDIEAT